jgi:hypothetical protein
MTTPQTSTTTDLNKTRIAFMERASAPHIPPHAFKLAWLIAYRYMNRDSQTARPAQNRLARDLNVSDRHVRRLLDILRPLGLGITPGDGRGKASSYWLDPLTSTGAERRTPTSTFTGQKVDKKGGLQATKKVDSRVRPTNKENQEESFVGELKLSPQRLERDVRASREEIPSLGGDPPAGAGPRQESSPLTATPNPRKESKRTSEGETADRSEILPPAVIAGRESSEHWHELRSLWARGWAGDDSPKAQAIARAAFDKACQEVAPEDLIAAAKAWIAAADAPRFLPPLVTWLTARGWETPPPIRPRRGGNGAHHQSSRKPDLAEIALGYAREYAAERAAS